ncbi:PREDICTED: uncharacterized protein LOC104612845 isoform X3 [Nelumbo nucifera]|uniref:Uncharacterized protein LOC104612845 isoform X3 n=1 Tax=Nelumbo nucifera TaxID=4432 RepID=A0A1U8BBK3_NELNU|nr:PREDICTED: uncharacterized protein LOC104612845 isoform X3 [Nelumbo nucifera]
MKDSTIPNAHGKKSFTFPLEGTSLELAVSPDQPPDTSPTSNVHEKKASSLSPSEGTSMELVVGIVAPDQPPETSPTCNSFGKKASLSPSDSTSSQLPPRPLNSWVLFSRDFIKSYKADHPEIHGLRSATMAAAEAWKAMSLEEKSSYNNQAKDAWEQYKSKTPRPPSPPKSKREILQTRCSPGRFLSVLKKLTVEQKVAVENVGFGSLLGIRCETLRRGLCQWLLERFDPARCCLHIDGKRIYITVRDVELVMGLPSSGHKVVTSGPDGAIAEMRRYYSAAPDDGGNSSISTGISLGLLEKQLETQEAGDEFKRSFALFALGTILCPTAKGEASPKFLHSLRKTDDIPKYNWAQFVLDRLLRETSRFHQGKQRAVGGCLLFLKFFFYEHTTIGGPSTFVPNLNVPRLLAWGEMEISERERKYREIGGYDFAEVVVEMDMGIQGPGQTSQEDIIPTGTADVGVRRHPTPEYGAIDDVLERLKNIEAQIQSLKGLESQIQELKDLICKKFNEQRPKKKRPRKEK